MAKQKSEKKSDWNAWINVRWKPGAPKSAASQWQKNKHIKGAWTSTGWWDCSLWIDASDPDQLEKIVWDTIRKSKWVEDTETQWVKQWW